MIRRILELGERKGKKFNLVVLDWEKAFDKVSHEGLFIALARLNVSDKPINMVKAIYNNPTFFVDIDGISSSTKKQNTGIRQGCPLSPYLFLTVMTAIFHDIHNNTDLERKSECGRIAGTLLDEVLFADDTILYSENPNTLTEFVRQIEIESAKYGLKFNYRKCEHICINGNDNIYYINGGTVPRSGESKYLGCYLNERADPTQEINKRVADTYSTWANLTYTGKNSDDTIKNKLITYDAVIRAKLMYGLESAQTNKTEKTG